MDEIANIWPALQLMIALAFWEISKYAIRLFLGKTIGADNISRLACEKYQKKIEKDLKAIKGILLVVAMKSGCEPEKLKSLTG